MSIRDLIKSRTLVEAKVNHFQAYLNRFIKDQTEVNKIELRLRVNKFEALSDEFNEVQSQIELLDSNNSEIDERIKFDDLFYSSLARAHQLLGENANNSANQSSEVVSAVSPVLTKLPAINLIQFSGKYEDWLPFIDMFNSLVHFNSSLTNVQKLHYLKSSVDDKAVHVIKSVELTEDNYEIAYALLKERYENIRLIAEQHIKMIFSLPQIDKENSSLLRQLFDQLQVHLRALKSLKLPVEHWDALLIHVLTAKLDPASYKAWQNDTSCYDRLPNMEEFKLFLKNRCLLLESLNNTKTVSKGAANISKQPMQTKSTWQSNRLSSYVTQSSACSFCSELHPLFACTKFKSSSHKDKIDHLKLKRICFNCLRPGHVLSACGASSCKYCKKKHNSLLCLNKESSNAADSFKSQNFPSCSENKDQEQPVPKVSLSGSSHTKFHQILLSTAIIQVKDVNGKYISCRALLDSGSQINIITRKLADRLGHSAIPGKIPISGVGLAKVTCTQLMRSEVKSRLNAFKRTLDFHIMDCITELIPNSQIEVTNLSIPKDIVLADPEFHRPQEIDMLMGSAIFWELICNGKFQPSPQTPFFQKTLFGWIVAGQITNDRGNNVVATSNSKPSSTICSLATEAIHQQLKNFWEIEELSQQTSITGEDAACEEHFKQNVARLPCGKIVVKLSVKPSVKELGDSRNVAIKRFHQLEHRFQYNKQLRNAYIEFMREYQSLGHMKLSQKTNTSPSYYLPHHPVMKDSSSTTKLRVVFDASAKSDSGVSLNDVLMVGPVVQDEQFDITLRFRLHKIALKADIEKMYRQILIDKSQINLQQILWRETPEDPIEEYQLQTVTYGTASAPYLATRSLNYLADQEGHRYPLGAQVLKYDFFMDDCVTGQQTRSAAQQLKVELIAILKRGGFHIRKWCSNDKTLLQDIESQNQEPPSQGSDGASVGVLGLMWNPTFDTISFNIKTKSILHNKPLTKRNVLSSIAQLFDPLGLICPFIIIAKLIMQQIWITKIDWDESLPMAIYTEWVKFLESLMLIGDVSIPRIIVTTDTDAKIEIHGFADASEKAYGACLYARCQNGITIKTALICAKSRVAPLKRVTIPRLELLAAVLLSQLMLKVIKSLKISICNYYCWTDSQIVLSWINSPSSHYHTFVANRISRIQTHTKPSQWRHVQSIDNPADLISRGCQLKSLVDSTLWWNGPVWLNSVENFWSDNLEVTTWAIDENIRELKEQNIVNITTCIPKSIIEIKNYSSFDKVLRVISYVKRFINNCRSERPCRLTSELTVPELNLAETTLIQQIQLDEFKQEISLIKNNLPCFKSSKIINLNPFMDKDGVLRVGGRLHYSALSYSQKHPIILPQHAFTDLLVRKLHHIYLHCGPTALLSLIRNKYWPIKARSTVKRIINRCITCFKCRPVPTQAIMGSLPPSRVIRPIRAFIHTGIDYCGPVAIRLSKGRGARTTKGYIALFICMATRAIHLELVSDLTTSAFLATLKRFIARRGLPSHMHSDNGRNFVGAKNRLYELYKLVTSDAHIKETRQYLTQQGIQWVHITPRAPHQGGIWERGVRSVKYHLNRIVGQAHLSFEEFYTVLCSIESVLNSRPLTPLSSEPSDLLPLTPSHFLCGDSLHTFPEEDYTKTPTNRLKRWQYVQQLYQNFWVRWTQEYLNHLQVRTKWTTSKKPIKLGTLVVLKEKHTHPLEWPMGRIVAVHPGHDGIVRIVTLKTQTGNLQRAVTQLCPLPIEDDIPYI